MIRPGVYIGPDISTDPTGAIATYASGLPYTAGQAIATGSGPVAYVQNGYPFNAAGRLVSAEGAAAVFQSGLAYAADGSLIFNNADGVSLVYNDSDYIYNDSQLYRG